MEFSNRTGSRDLTQLASHIDELRGAFEEYLSTPRRGGETAPATRFIQARSHPNVTAPPPSTGCR